MDKSATKLEKKVYKQMKAGEKSDEKVHKDIAKVLKHEKQEKSEESKAGKKGDKKLHEMAEKRDKKAKPVSKKPKAKAKIKKVMHEFKQGKLHSGSKKGPEVTKPKQAIAIALSEARKAGKKKKK